MIDRQPADAGWYPDVSGKQPGLTAERKRIYANDMLYVTDAAGTRVGSIDLGSGKVTVDQPERRAEFDEFIARWRASATERPPDPRPDAAAAAASASAGRDWRDLAPNRAGESARRRAVELRDEAPVRTFFARLFGIHTDERAFRVGADGEEMVGQQLAQLDDRWRVLHSVPVGDGDIDIDHVVIGPGGVFTLNTKHHARSKVWVADRAILVGGQKTHYLRNSRHEASRATDLLTSACGFDVHVEPIIVVIAKELTVRSQPVGVHVVPRHRIASWLERRPATLACATVDAVYDAARRDTTWRSH